MVGELRWYSRMPLSVALMNPKYFCFFRSIIFCFPLTVGAARWLPKPCSCKVNGCTIWINDVEKKSEVADLCGEQGTSLLLSYGFDATRSVFWFLKKLNPSLSRLWSFFPVSHRFLVRTDADRIMTIDQSPLQLCPAPAKPALMLVLKLNW